MLLEKHPRNRTGFRNLKRKAPVTIIVGIVCQDAIVVASDSQTTWGHSSKSMNAEKLHGIEFKNAGGIMATAGDVTFAYRVAEITQAICSSKELRDGRQLAESAEEACRQMRAVMVEPYVSLDLDAESMDKVLEKNEYSLLMANYFGEEPRIYTLDFPPGVAVRRKQYAAVGCGAVLAEFLLSWFPFEKMNFVETSMAAAFIIGEVKQADTFCGGQTQLKRIRPDMLKMDGPDPDILRIIENEVKKGSDKYKNSWGVSAREMAQEILKQLPPDPPEIAKT
jgi:20S proteasome alpha/beta subunit